MLRLRFPHMLGSPILSTIAGAVASRIVDLKEDSLRAAVEKELSKIAADRGLLEKNINGFYLSFTREPVEVPDVERVRRFLPLYQP